MVSDFSRSTIDHCFFGSNSGGASGGGLLFDVGDDQIVQEVKFSVFFNNSASGSGAHLAVSFNLAQVTIERCTFGPPAAGSSAGIRINSDYPESVLLDSCIVYGGVLPSIDAEPNSTVANYSCIEGLATARITSSDCIDEDPLFVDSEVGELSLLPGSPCIDGGNPALPFDADGSVADMGAFADQNSGTFRRGDGNADGTSNVADAIHILGMLFVQGSDPLNCFDAGDCNDDGLLNISDAVTLLDSLFVSGVPLPAPVGRCGADPTPDSLDCADLCT